MPKGRHRPQATCHPDRPHHAKGMCRLCYANNRSRIKWAENPVSTPESAARSLRWYYRNRQKYLDSARNWKAIAKKRVLTHYGKNGILLCCWTDCKEDDIDILTLDHINDDGAEQRTILGQSNTYRWVEKNNYPLDFQTLCFNHQWKKEIARRKRNRGKS